MSVLATSFRNNAGRYFEVGDNAVVANHSSFPGRVIPCRIARVETQVVGDEVRREVAVSVELYPPASGDAVVHNVNPEAVFPSFEAATVRPRVPKCLVRFANSNPVLVAIIHSQGFLDGERFRTLDHWQAQLDSFVDSNDLGDEQREHVDRLRDDVSRERLNALRREQEERDRRVGGLGHE